jgi:hypothetical protein
MFARFVSSAYLPAAAVLLLAVGLSFAGQPLTSLTQQTAAPDASVLVQPTGTTTAQQDSCPECCPDCPVCPTCCGAACCDSTAAKKPSDTKEAQSCSGSSCCTK